MAPFFAFLTIACFGIVTLIGCNDQSHQDGWQALHARFEVNVSQLEKLKQGLVPKSSDDRWAMNYDGAALYIYRVASDELTFKCAVDVGEQIITINQCFVNESLVNRSLKSPESARAMLEQIIIAFFA